MGFYLVVVPKCFTLLKLQSSNILTSCDILLTDLQSMDNVSRLLKLSCRFNGPCFVVFCNRGYSSADPTSKNSCSHNDRFSMFAALIIYWSRLTQRVGERIVCVNLNLDDAIVKDRLTDNIQDINHLKSCAPRITKNFDALGFFLLDERVLLSGDITSLIKNLLFLCVRSVSIRLSHARVNVVALTRAIW